MPAKKKSGPDQFDVNTVPRPSRAMYVADKKWATKERAAVSQSRQAATKETKRKAAASANSARNINSSQTRRNQALTGKDSQGKGYDYLYKGAVASQRARNNRRAKTKGIK